MTQLSVNVNKIATLRNARGGNVPDLIQLRRRPLLAQASAGGASACGMVRSGGSALGSVSLLRCDMRRAGAEGNLSRVYIEGGSNGGYL